MWRDIVRKDEVQPRGFVRRTGRTASLRWVAIEEKPHALLDVLDPVPWTPFQGRADRIELLSSKQSIRCGGTSVMVVEAAGTEG